MERKDFIKLSSLGILGLYSCGISNIMTTKETLAIQLYTIRDAVSQNPEKALEKLAQLGFNQLEIYGYDGLFFGRNLNEFKQILNNTGLKVISSHHTTGIVHPGKGSLMTNWEQTVEDLQSLGTKYMVCSYLFPEERTVDHYKKLPDLLENSGTVTQKADIQFAYHNHDFEFDSFDEKGNAYDFILRNTSSDRVKMELDLYWIAKAGLNTVDYFEKYPGRFPLWHIKDMKAGNNDFTEIGNGTIDFRKIFRYKEKAGLKHWFLEQDSSDKNIFESIAISKKFIQQNSFFDMK
ncbi:sugar phosphate isomerase/epimerase family protein [Chryseobacterium echinoideorum]|uniref:sugar phosphate isomerase/epimerase family protein n=1 Tax=Chryseobacterium echinoideorum TaxID=1549648 RepID=UPI001186571F|nr:sugar phosphate isomerase/epimerase [Chryseobacterium echinoideorum]